MKTSDDTDILSARAVHPICGPLHYERVSQDRRIYYRLGPSGGSITDAKHARESIAYWRSKGWIPA